MLYSILDVITIVNSIYQRFLYGQEEGKGLVELEEKYLNHYNVAMRLSDAETAIIVSTIQGSLPNSEIFLFGSRANDKARGGDIDLFVRTAKSVHLGQKLQLLVQLQRAGIQRKVDLVIESPQHTQAKIRSEVLKKGLRLY